MAEAARRAAREVARAGAGTRSRAIRETAARLRADAPRILEANAADVHDARVAGLDAPHVDRLLLDGPRLEGLAAALDAVAERSDPVGAFDRMWRRPNGLLVGKMRIPLGVILMIYESRPNVTTDAFALCLRAGNAVLLRGGSEARRTNVALGAAIAAGLRAAGLPAEAAQVVPAGDRALVEALLLREAEIDLVIPR